MVANFKGVSFIRETYAYCCQTRKSTVLAPESPALAPLGPLPTIAQELVVQSGEWVKWLKRHRTGKRPYGRIEVLIGPS
jgi:hypothetical protein